MTPIKLSHSTRSVLHSCPRKLMLRTIFRKPWTPSKSAQIGVAFHKLMELAVTIPLDKVDKAYNKWRKAVLLDFVGQPKEVKDDLKLAHDLGVSLWNGYMRRITQLEPSIVEIVSAEHRFLHEISDVTVPGVIDLIALIVNPWFNHGEAKAILPSEQFILALVDYKTTGLQLDIYAEKLRRSEQLETYMLWAKSPAFAKTFPVIHEKYGNPVAVIFDLIATPKIRQKKKESDIEFFARYLEEVETGEDNIRRVVLVPTDRELIDTKMGFAQDRRDYEHYIETSFWPKRETACITFGKICEHSSECGQCSNGSLDKVPRLIQIEEVPEDDGDSD